MTNERIDTIFVSDLDGTLLQGDAQLSSSSRDGILRLLEAGVHFTVATARSVTSTREILGSIPFVLPVVCANGGAIFNYSSAEPLQVEFLPDHLVNQLIGDLHEKSDSAFVSVHLDRKEHIFYQSLSNGGMHWYHQDREEAGDDRLEQIPDIRAAIGHQVTTITYMDSRHRIKALRRFLLKKYGTTIQINSFENKYSPGWYWLSVHSANATKANALKRLKELTGMRHHRLVVFGDELNDLPMFEYAETAIAVSNALPSVKRAANLVIGANTSDAVIQFILESHKMA